MSRRLGEKCDTSCKWSRKGLKSKRDKLRKENVSCFLSFENLLADDAICGGKEFNDEGRERVRGKNSSNEDNIFISKEKI